MISPMDVVRLREVLKNHTKEGNEVREEESRIRKDIIGAIEV